MEKEKINHPEHYGGDNVYEVIKIIEHYELEKDAYLFNVIKYILRAGKKDNYQQDLEKALWYLNRKVQRMKSETENKIENIENKLNCTCIEETSAFFGRDGLPYCKVCNLVIPTLKR